MRSLAKLHLNQLYSLLAMTSQFPIKKEKTHFWCNYRDFNFFSIIFACSWAGPLILEGAGKQLSMLIASISGLIALILFLEDRKFRKSDAKQRLMDCLSARLNDWSEHPEAYLAFEKYIEKVVSCWTPERNYKDLGYLPKTLVYDEGLHRDISEFKPGASAEEKNLFTILQFEELVWNTQVAWPLYVAQHQERESLKDKNPS